MLIALAAALARPMLATSSSRESIVYAVDVSYSVSSTAIEAAAKRIDDLNAALRPSHFAHRRLRCQRCRDGRYRGASSARPRRRASCGSTAATVNRRGTDLEAALGAARAELAAGSVPRIVLFTDGHSTGGRF